MTRANEKILPHVMRHARDLGVMFGAATHIGL